MIGQLLLGIVAGALLGALFLGGLALTVRRLPHSRRPGLLMLGSFAIRASVIVAAFVLLALQSPLAFAVAFGVFVLARFATLWVGAGPAAAVPEE